MNKQECTGCRLCGDCCPKQSVSFHEDYEGFFYPLVDASTCINCGLCAKVCPVLHTEKNDKGEHSYAVYANETEKRDAGSSG